MKEDVFIYPTDTVWGIGGNIHVDGMATKVNKIKGYDEVKPLSILFCNLDMLSDYFQLELFDKDWLEGLFEKQATLGLPVDSLKMNIPSEAYGGSTFVCVRVLSTPLISELIEKAGGPVFTTSFNEKGEDPILESSAAIKLKNKVCPNAQIIGEGIENLSGHSSTIIVYKGNNQFEVLRPGKKIEEIEKHIALLTT
ncbi:MAG: hypothetical protein CME70_00705 [Halobacteriovorax sp.]|nr:hypothetical protein [Halobacteriovorax sp.]|tara:strand:+ start:87011 stop:87598 length:588 start_codon:yes stop_codon:yes gene_type:complete